MPRGRWNIVTERKEPSTVKTLAGSCPKYISAALRKITGSLDSNELILPFYKSLMLPGREEVQTRAPFPSVREKDAPRSLGNGTNGLKAFPGSRVRNRL